MDFDSFSWYYLIPLPYSCQYTLITRDLEGQNPFSKQAGGGSPAALQPPLDYKPLLDHMQVIPHWLPLVAETGFGEP